MNLEPKRLYRSRKDRMVGGVCAGIGEYLNMDPTIIRILFVLLGFVTGGTWIIVYLILLFVIPEEPGYAAPSAPAARPVTQTPAAPAPVENTESPEDTTLPPTL